MKRWGGETERQRGETGVNTNIALLAASDMQIWPNIYEQSILPREKMGEKMEEL